YRIGWLVVWMLLFGAQGLLGQYAYIPDAASNTVAVVSLTSNTVVNLITVGPGPQGVAISPDRTKVYVANTAGTTVSVISTASNTVVATIPVGSRPYSVVVSPNGTNV